MKFIPTFSIKQKRERVVMERERAMQEGKANFGLFEKTLAKQIASCRREDAVQYPSFTTTPSVCSTL